MQTDDLAQPDHNPASDPSLRRGRRGLAAGLAIGLLGGAAVGLVFGVPGLTSATASDLTAQSEQTATTVPEEPTDPAQVVEDLEARSTERLREELQQLVDDGTISAEQADAVAAHLAGSVFDRAETWLGEHGIDLADLADLADFDLGKLHEQLGQWRERFESGEFGDFGKGGHWGGHAPADAPDTTTAD